MSASKVIINGVTKIDLTSDTVQADKVLYGYTGHKNDGSAFTGTVTFSTIYTGSNTPSSSTGVNGDIYLKVVG